LKIVTENTLFKFPAPNNLPIPQYCIL